jgi:hypothetical protein
MTLVGEMPPWMQRHFAVYAARSSHNFCAKQIRKKLIVETSADALLAEAFAMVNRDIGTFPSEENPANSPFPDDEDESTERDMRDIAMRNYDSLSEIETYMWRLGIAGVFPQWERGTRDVIATLARKPPPPEKLENMHFGELCKQVKKTGFDIELHRAFSGLRLACLKRIRSSMAAANPSETSRPKDQTCSKIPRSASRLQRLLLNRIT